MSGQNRKAKRIRFLGMNTKLNFVISLRPLYSKYPIRSKQLNWKFGKLIQKNSGKNSNVNKTLQEDNLKEAVTAEQIFHANMTVFRKKYFILRNTT